MASEGAHSFCSACGARASNNASVCGCCGRKQYPNWRLAAGVAIALSGGLLMLQRASDPWAGHWEFAGGFVEAGEDPEAAVRREVLEELSIKIDEPHLLGLYIDEYSHDDDPTVVGTANAYYWATVASSALLQPKSAEVAAVEVFKRQSPPASVAFPRQTLAVWHDYWRIVGS